MSDFANPQCKYCKCKLTDLEVLSYEDACDWCFAKNIEVEIEFEKDTQEQEGEVPKRT